MGRLYLLANTGQENFKKVNQLIKDIERGGYEGTGKPEALSGNLAGFWSRRIDDTNRLVYRIVEGTIEIAQCKGHYDDK
jgi:toxin YoeB